MDGSGTMVMLSRQHGDRWSSYGEHAGIQNLSSLLSPSQLKQYEIFQEFDDEFLREISPDVTLAKWNAKAVVFEEGTYLDLAFYVVEGEVEMFLARHEAGAHQPIFTAKADTPIGEKPQNTGADSKRAPASDGSIVFLASLDFDLARGDKMRLGVGEIFGEISAMNGWPQSATAQTATPCTLLQMRLPALRKLRRKSKRLKQRLDELYRARMLRQHLASTPLLTGCDAQVIEKLAQKAELVSCIPDDVVTREGDPVEHLIMLRSGSLKMSQKLGVGEIVVSYVSKGSTIGESELLVDDGGGWQTTTMSVAHSELVRINKTDILEIIATHPELEQRLWAVATERIKSIGSTKSNLRRADLLDFTIAKGMIQANSVLVIDLDLCTRCDDCVRGCASTHGGVPKFVREGEVYDGFMVARSCYHCQDPVCLVGCPTGAIHRINVGDVVEVDPAICIGCGACAENCPYDAIVMHDLGTTWGADAMPRHLRGQPRAVASKCDLCRTAPEGPACVSSCPHGATSRVAGAEAFDALLEAKRRGAAAR